MSTVAIPAPAGEPRVAHWRAELAQGRERLRADFIAQSNPPPLLRGLTRLTDGVVTAAWKEAGIPS
ncbi:MAG TPA: hypothetical protein VN707_09000, partial [Casimicrobiaceae bacterium]|nr:hypothetical protein [Casimicrobiaceae bacterium]